MAKATQKLEKPFHYKKNLTPQDADKYTGAHTSLVKQLGLPLSTPNMTLKNCHVIEEHATQRGT
jgi:hypothetical protein